ncbi:MAG: response regulator [Acidobacteria bacterium]|nr:response regulator [Acidobacteriota bacterium]
MSDKARVLIVDDEEKNLVALEAVLEGEADEIVRAHSGNEALKRLLENDFAVILLDVQMPEMDGFETARLIRQRERSRTTPIIFVTAVSRTEENVFRGYSLGAVDYLFKPVVAEILKSKVSIFVELFRSRNEIARQAHDLWKLNQRMERVVNGAADGIVSTDSEGRITLANPAAAEMLGRSVNELVGAGVEEVFDACRRDGEGLDHDCGLTEAILTSQFLTGDDFVFVRPDGTEIPIELTASPLPGPEQKREGGCVVLFRDVTERRAMEMAEEHARRFREAENANRAKDEFLAVLSHELRTPMTAILGWSKMLKTEELDEENFQFAIDSISRSASLQAQLIEDILDVSRIVTGKLFVDEVDFDLAEIVAQAVETVRHRADEKEILITLDLPEVKPKIKGDPARMQQVIWNLLSNSIKFTPRGGSIRASVSAPATGEVVVRIEDTGQGIDKELLPFIFDRFRQAEASSTRAHGGLGLGLGIVRYLVEAHGGSVAAESEGPGKGSTFSVTLPIADESDARSRSEGSDDDSGVTPLHGHRILVVDDDASIRRLLATILRQSGAEVEIAETVPEAMEKLKQIKPELVVCDIAMPEQDGFDLLRNIRKADGEIPVIALTAFASVDDRERIHEAGFAGHLHKPINSTALVASVGRALKVRA